MSDGITSFLFGGQTPVAAPTGSDTSSAFPLWLQQDLFGTIGAANNLAGQPFAQFSGPQVYTPSSSTTAAWNLANQNVGNWSPYLSQAGALTANSAAPVTSGDVSNLLNPFENYVTGALNYNLMNNILPQVQSQFVSAGQAASPQQAQVAGQAIRNTQDAAGQALAGAYQGALSSALQNKQLGLQGGATLGQLGALTSQLGAVDTSQLAAAGQAQDILQQQNINAALNDFYRQQQWPYQNLSFLSDITRGLPWQAAGMTSQTAGLTYPSAYGASPFSSLLGGVGIGSALGLAKGGQVGPLTMARGGKVRRFALGGTNPLSENVTRLEGGSGSGPSGGFGFSGGNAAATGDTAAGITTDPGAFAMNALTGLGIAFGGPLGALAAYGSTLGNAALGKNAPNSISPMSLASNAWGALTGNDPSGVNSSVGQSVSQANDAMAAVSGADMGTGSSDNGAADSGGGFGDGSGVGGPMKRGGRVGHKAVTMHPDEAYAKIFAPQEEKSRAGALTSLRRAA